MFSDVLRSSQDALKSQVANGLNFISNENVDFNDQKEFDDPRHSLIQREIQLEV